MKTKLYLQSLENDLTQRYDSSNIYLTEYFNYSSMLLNRDGLFFTLFNKLVDSSIAQTPHILLSRFDLFKDQSEYYRIKNNFEVQFDDNSTFILLFNINLLETPLELLNDFLKWFHENYLRKYSKLKISAHYNYNVDTNNSLDQKYLLSYFQLIQKYLGLLPEALSLKDLEKKASFKNCLIVEAGSQWSCLDNYLVHLALSKGACLHQPDLDNSKYKILSEHLLSPNHSIQKIKKLQCHDTDLVCPFLEDLRNKDFFKHPEDMKLFYFLIYKNIFNP
ncbi:MAG: hypothetical protein H7281_04395 [Bacteriovorax sp.]|nr:hypothetical protein [Bacteriovorax sp.]